MTGASGQGLVKGNYNAIGALGEGQEPSVCPELGGSVVLTRIFPESHLDPTGFIDKRHPVIAKQPVVRGPCFGHAQRFAVHDGRRSEQTQDPNLS